MKDSELPLEKMFPLSRDELVQVLTTALSRGGEFSDIFLEHRVHHVITMEEDIVRETSESISSGLGIRVIFGDMTGYGYTNDLSFEKVEKVARTAGAVAAEGKGKRLGVLRPTVLGENFYPLSFPADKARLEEKISLVKRAYEAAQGVDRKIKKIKDQIKAKQGELHSQFMKAVDDGLAVEPGPFALELDTKKHRFSPPYKTWLEDAIGASSIEAKLEAYKKENGIPEEDRFVRVVKIRQPVESRVD